IAKMYHDGMNKKFHHGGPILYILYHSVQLSLCDLQSVSRQMSDFGETNHSNDIHQETPVVFVNELFTRLFTLLRDGQFGPHEEPCDIMALMRADFPRYSWGKVFES